MPSPSTPPAPQAQAVVSVALAIYLVGLGLSIAGNSVSGSSALVATLKERLFTPWMAPAWLDLGFDHPLTYGLPEDADHELAVRRTGGPAGAIELPGPRSGERARRWRRLARRIATSAADDAAAPLAAAVGGGGFAPLGTDDVVVRVIRRPLEERDSGNAAAGPVAAYAARVRRIAGEIQLIESGGAAKAAEMAPLLRPESAVGGSP